MDVQIKVFVHGRVGHKDGVWIAQVLLKAEGVEEPMETFTYGPYNSKSEAEDVMQSEANRLLDAMEQAAIVIEERFGPTLH